MPNTHSTLAALFDDIADSIRSKAGTSETIVADTFPEAIAAIPTGGGGSGGEYNVISTDNGDGTQDIEITDAEGAVSVIPLNVTENGTYTAPSGQAYSPVTVNVPAPTPEPPTLEIVNITPSESSQRRTPSAGFDGIGEVNVGAIPSNFVGSGVARKSSSDLTVSGATVNVPAGYYESDASKAVSAGKAAQACDNMERVTSTSYTGTSVSLTVEKTGVYTVRWYGYRTSTSGTNGSQLYIGNTAYGSAQTTFGVNSNGQTVKLTGVSLTAGQTITVRARSRSTSYYMWVMGLSIIEE